MTVKTEASLVRKPPEKEHGSEIRGNEIIEVIIILSRARRLYSDPLRSEHLFFTHKEEKMVRPKVEPELAQVYPQAAGIDIGASEHWVSIPSELDAEPVRKFSCFTADLYAIAEWLKSRGITTVAMESTGVRLAVAKSSVLKLAR
jgi:hypothetical protein